MESVFSIATGKPPNSLQFGDSFAFFTWKATNLLHVFAVTQLPSQMAREKTFRAENCLCVHFLYTELVWLLKSRQKTWQHFQISVLNRVKSLWNWVEIYFSETTTSRLCLNIDGCLNCFNTAATMCWTTVPHLYSLSNSLLADSIISRFYQNKINKQKLGKHLCNLWVKKRSCKRRTFE